MIYFTKISNDLIKIYKNDENYLVSSKNNSLKTLLENLNHKIEEGGSSY